MNRTSEQRSTRMVADLCRVATKFAHPLVVVAFPIILAATFATPAGATDRWFMVEIIVFDRPDGKGLRAEHWPADPGEPLPASAVALTHAREMGGQGADSGYRLVSPSERSLNAVRNRLQRSGSYRPILHAGWRMPGLPRGTARPAHVRPGLGGTGAGAVEHAGATHREVHGTVTVSLARYLEVDLDLLYRRPAGEAAAAPATTPTRFRLVSQRRMRSRELHYIDHPLFGVLIMLTPI